MQAGRPAEQRRCREAACRASQGASSATFRCQASLAQAISLLLPAGQLPDLDCYHRSPSSARPQLLPPR